MGLKNNMRFYRYLIPRLGVKGIFNQILYKMGRTQEDIFGYLSRNYYSLLDPQTYEIELGKWYYAVTGRDPGFIKNPITYNDKIQWLKIYDMSSLKSRLADKYLVREWVAREIGEEYLIPIYGVWKSFDEIEFDKLPQKFVLKCNHGSANSILVDNKNCINYTEQKKKFDYWVSLNYGFRNGFELQYRDIEPRIIAEYKLENNDGSQVDDYKFFVFNGDVKIIQVDIDRFGNHRRNFYTTEWEYIPMSVLYPTDKNVEVARPLKLEKMIAIARKLAGGFIHVRVDLYYLKEQIYFGEMTFTHGSGVEPFIPERYGEEMGKWMALPVEDKEGIC